jgi:hypothetical protein
MSQFPIKPELQTQNAWLVSQYDYPGQTVDGVHFWSTDKQSNIITSNKPIRLISIVYMVIIDYYS